MITKHKSWLFAALFVLAGLFSAQAQNAVHNKAYYDAITYQWTDASGASHENCVTDEATDPYQIVALLKKVYCDPRLPGPRFSAYDKNGEREREVYYGAVDGGWNISASDVTPPYEEGYTVLMVSLNNTITPIGEDTEQLVNFIDHWILPDEYEYDTFNSNFFTTANELIDYVGRNITSVLLLTDGMRLGSGENAGTAFNVSGNYNRFFLLGKGQARQKDQPVIDREEENSTYPIIAGEYVPFKKMFEEFSPTDGSENSQITDFYSKMIAGDVYPVVHDCNSVIEKQHEFSMSGKTGTDYKSLTGLNIFIPDYRLKYWVNDHYYLYYTNNWGQKDSIGPFVVDGRTMNPWRNTSGNQMTNQYNPYTSSNPSWLCAHYAQYNPNNSPRVGLYTVKLDADAEQAAAEHTYNVVLDWTSSLDDLAGEAVPQTYTVYIVDEYGYNTELVVTDQTTYTYTVPQEEHSYTLTYVVYATPTDTDHYMFVAWSNTDDVVIPGWNDFLALGIDHYESDYVIESELNYYRNFFNLTNLDELNAFTTERVAAGENQFVLYRYDMAAPNSKTQVATVNLSVVNNGVRYNVEYQDQDMRPNYDIEVKTSDVLPVNGGVIDLSGLMLVDQFSADVSENEHPERYGYVLSLGELGDAAKTTNSVEIPVIKNYGMNLGYYTDEQIQNDKNAELTAGVKNADVMYELYNTQEVYYVDLLRGDNAAPNEEISHLQRRTDGSFFEFSNVLPQYAGNVEWYWADRFDNNMVVVGNYNDFMTYVPITWTFGEDRVKKDGENSYGGEIYKNYVADVDVEVTGTVSDHGTFANWLDENEEECAIFNPVITVDAKLPTQGNWEYKPAMYRVWLKCDNRRGYTKNPKNGHSVNDPTAELSNFDLIVEDNVDGDAHEVYGNANTDELAFGATFASRYSGISFLVRMYYEVDANLFRDIPSGMPAYYVVEKEMPWSNMVTGIKEISSSNEVAKTYYNAQGLSSDKPFDGVNIVVTRYSDGTTKTDKFVR